MSLYGQIVYSPEVEAAFTLLLLAGKISEMPVLAMKEEKETEVLKYLRLKPEPRSSDDKVPIGYGHAKVPARVLKHLDWTSYTTCTRKLLTTLFPRKVLATHSLTGKSSPAFPNKQAKKQLDPLIIEDIVQIVSERCGIKKSLVRTSITTKCADECKMQRMRLQKSRKGKSRKAFIENIPPKTENEE